MKNIILLTLVFLVLISCTNSENKNERIEWVTEPDKAEIENMLSSPSMGLFFINEYIDSLNQDILKDGEFDEMAFIENHRFLTKKLKKVYYTKITEAEKNSPGYGLGYDPIINAQDYPDKGFEIDTFDIPNLIVTVRGIDQAGFKVKMKLKIEKGNWLINGIGDVNMPKEK